jgi:hypothetical protein
LAVDRVGLALAVDQGVVRNAYEAGVSVDGVLDAVGNILREAGVVGEEKATDALVADIRGLKETERDQGGNNTGIVLDDVPGDTGNAGVGVWGK